MDEDVKSGSWAPSRQPGHEHSTRKSFHAVMGPGKAVPMRAGPHLAYPDHAPVPARPVAGTLVPPVGQADGGLPVMATAKMGEMVDGHLHASSLNAFSIAAIAESLWLCLAKQKLCGHDCRPYKKTGRKLGWRKA